MYNPLNDLIGTWEGNQGLDLAPLPNDEEVNPYYETLVIEPIDLEIKNSKKQNLLSIKYNQEIREISNDKISHSEVGYWIWEPADNSIINSFSIPRGASILAGGTFEALEDRLLINVKSSQSNFDWGIVQSPFLQNNAQILDFKRTLVVKGGELSYEQETKLFIYDKTYIHKDSNLLRRV